MRRAFVRDDLDLVRVAMLLEAVRRDNVSLDGSGLGFALRQALERTMRRLLDNPNLPAVQKMKAAVGLVRMLPFEVNLWHVQNDCYRGLERLRGTAEPGILHAWEELARNLGINPEAAKSVAQEPALEPVVA